MNNAVPTQEDNDIVDFVATEDKDVGSAGEEALQLIVERVAQFRVMPELKREKQTTFNCLF